MVMAACAGRGIDVPVGPANLRVAERVYTPRTLRALPSWALAPALLPRRSTPGSTTTSSGSCGATTYMSPPPARRATGRTATAPPSTSSPPTATHRRSGTHPPDASPTISAGPRRARPSGTRPVCRLAPAIQFVGYDGYPNHGSPRTCAAGCPAHLHLSWASPCYGTSSPSPPCEWVMAFPTSRST